MAWATGNHRRSSPSPSSSSGRTRPVVVAADTASRYCALLLLTLLLLSSLGEVGARDLRGARFLTGAAAKPCAEIYIVGQGETLHTIGDKCGDPFIIERNPHIHDPDDVYPGLVIKIVPLAPRP